MSLLFVDLKTLQRAVKKYLMVTFLTICFYLTSRLISTKSYK